MSRRIWRTQWLGHAAALCSIAAVSLSIALVHQQISLANLPLLYLGAVLGIAGAFGSGPAILAAIASFWSFNWFFTDPHSLSLTDPNEAAALLLFLLTAVATGQLAANLRQRAIAVEQREREAVILYDIATLMEEADREIALRAVAERLIAELALSTMTIDVFDNSNDPKNPRPPDRLDAGSQEADLSSYFVTAKANDQADANFSRALRDPARIGRPFRARAVGTTRSVVPLLILDRQIGRLILTGNAASPAFSPSGRSLLSSIARQLAHSLEHKRLERDVTEAEILRSADRVKTSLLNAVSHNLRTPLASIIAAAGSLLQDDVAWTRHDRREFAETIRDEAQRLNRIVENLLDLSRIQAGGLRPQRSWHDLSTLLEDVRIRLRSLAASHKLVMDIPDGLPPLNLDAIAIDQVVSNLIENAVKYAPPGTEILVSAKLEEAEVQVAIADRGPGIPAAVISHLFQPFYRPPEVSRRNGAGLGLAVAKGLIASHGGRIWAENRPDGGARFVFALPLLSPALVETETEGSDEP